MTDSTTLRTAPGASRADRLLVDRLHEAGREAHPGISVAADEFAAGALARARWLADDAGGSVEAALTEMLRRGRGPDLYLALACDLSKEGAWERLVADGLPPVARALTAQGVPPAEADAIAAELPGHLVQPPKHGRSRTRLGGYRGGSRLTTFLATAAFALRTSERRARPLASLDAASVPGGEPAFASTAPPAHVPVEDAEAAAQLEVALPSAWSRLTRQEALVLLLKCRDGLPQKTIALLLGIGPPRVSRLVDSAHGRLRAALAGGTSGAPPIAAASSAALLGVLERFLATSFPGVRPGMPPGSRAPVHEDR